MGVEMASPNDLGDGGASGQINAELRHAQLEILSAQVATDRLRLRYSAEDLARHAQRDILRKAWSSANALFEYYNAIVNQMPDRHALEKSTAMTIDEAKILDTSDRMARYLPSGAEPRTAEIHGGCGLHVLQPDGIPRPCGRL